MNFINVFQTDLKKPWGQVALALNVLVGVGPSVMCCVLYGNLEATEGQQFILHMVTSFNGSDLLPHAHLFGFY